jgi:hypothetical protein
MAKPEKPARPAAKDDRTPKHTPQKQHDQPKTESSSEFEGAASRKPSGKPGVETKTETSSGSGK